MKTTLLLFLLTIATSAAQITWTATFTGTPDDADRLAAQLLVDDENTRRLEHNAAFELSDGDANFLAQLPTGTGAELKASTQTVVSQFLNGKPQNGALLASWWGSYIERAQQILADQVEANARRRLAVRIKEAIDRGATEADIQSAIDALNP